MENKNNLNPIISYLTLVENVYALPPPFSEKYIHCYLQKHSYSFFHKSLLCARTLISI